MRIFLALVSTALHRASRRSVRVGPNYVSVGAVLNAACLTAVESWHSLAHCLVIAEVLGLP